jgi:hypothetical protein
LSHTAGRTESPDAGASSHFTLSWISDAPFTFNFKNDDLKKKRKKEKDSIKRREEVRIKLKETKRNVAFQS